MPTVGDFRPILVFSLLLTLQFQAEGIHILIKLNCSKKVKINIKYVKELYLSDVFRHTKQQLLIRIFFFFINSVNSFLAAFTHLKSGIRACLSSSWQQMLFPLTGNHHGSSIKPSPGLFSSILFFLVSHFCYLAVTFRLCMLRQSSFTSTTKINHFFFAPMALSIRDGLKKK